MNKFFLKSGCSVSVEMDGVDYRHGVAIDFATGDRAYLNGDALRALDVALGRNTVGNLEPEAVWAVAEQLAEAGFVTADAELSGGRFRPLVGDPPLRVLFIETTKACNLRCAHCYVHGVAESLVGQLTEDEVCGLVDQADEMGVMEIQLTGGEFLVKPWAVPVVREARRRLIPCSIFTNGTILNGDLRQLLQEEAHGLIFYISLDGFREVHDRFRGVAGAFDKTVANIRSLCELGCDVRVNTCIGRHNLASALEFADWVGRELPVMQRLVPIELIGKAEGRAEMGVTEEEFADLLRSVGDDIGFLDSHDQASSEDWETPACGVGSAMMFVDAFGNASLCPTLNQDQDGSLLAGNVRHATLREIWTESPVYKRFRLCQCREVAECPSRERCRGGCRARAYLASRRTDAPDVSMCRLFLKSA